MMRLDITSVFNDLAPLKYWIGLNKFTHIIQSGINAENVMPNLNRPLFDNAMLGSVVGPVRTACMVIIFISDNGNTVTVGVSQDLISFNSIKCM